MAHGARAGVATAAGVSAGLVGHTLLAALGLGALLMSSEVIFDLVKWLGAVYLAYLGIMLLRADAAPLETEGAQRRPLFALLL